MRRSQADKAITHAKIVAVAARRFREKGLNGIGVADLMKQAGTTAGGFYKHFASRDDLVIEALAEAFKSTDLLEQRSPDLPALLREYLAEQHFANPGVGCPFATLAGDMRHAGTGERTLFTERLKRVLEHHAAGLKGGNAQSRRARAILLFSAAVGGLTLARSLNDKQLSQDLLTALQHQLTSMAREPLKQTRIARSKRVSGA